MKKDEEYGFKTISNVHISERHTSNLKNEMLILIQNENLEDRIFKKTVFPLVAIEWENNIPPTLTQKFYYHIKKLD